MKDNDKLIKEYTKAEVTDFNIHLVNEIYKSEEIAFVCHDGEVNLVEYDNE